jgi:hypothetical protein
LSRLDHQASLYREKGKIARSAQIAVKTAFREGLRKANPNAYTELLREFWLATFAAAPENIFEDLAKGPLSSVDNAVAFLLADPYFFHSGYLKQRLLKNLKYVKLDRKQTACLETLIVDRVERPNQFHFKDYARLAAFLESPSLMARIEGLADSPDKAVQLRALRVLENIRQRKISKERT